MDFIPEGDIDPYRYAEDRQGKENMANIVQVSFDNVYKSAKKFMTVTDSILNRLSTLFNEYKLGTYYEAFSRNQIMMIAKELPIYKDRNDSSFQLIKDNIRKKYNISGCKLSAIINIIKNSRRLSYYIKYNRNEQTEIIHLLEKFILENLSTICNFDDSIIIVSNKEIDLNIIQIKHKEAMDFLSRFSIDDMAKVFSYYKMGCKISHPEDFEKVFNESVEYFNNSEISEARKYFITKLQGRNFINFIMHGVYASGDYEIFLALSDFLKKETTFPTEQFDKLKEDLE